MKLLLPSLAVVLSTLLLASSSTTPAAANSNPDDPKGKSIYVVSPSCDYYKCKVDWARGSTQKIAWLNAPSGELKIQLESTGSGKTYTITDKVSSVHNETLCKSYAGKESCGTTNWTVPNDVALGEYTVAVTSLKNGHVGYTDRVIIKKAKSKRSSLSADDESLDEDAEDLADDADEGEEDGEEVQGDDASSDEPSLEERKDGKSKKKSHKKKTTHKKKKGSGSHKKTKGQEEDEDCSE